MFLLLWRRPRSLRHQSLGGMVNYYPKGPYLFNQPTYIQQKRQNQYIQCCDKCVYSPEAESLVINRADN
jgi:hypothetical protein